MIKKLKHRFILLTMSCLGFIFFLILLILNISMTAASQKRGFDLLSEHIRNKNTPEPYTGKPCVKDNADDDKIPPVSITGNRPNDWLNDMRIFQSFITALARSEKSPQKAIQICQKTAFCLWLIRF